MTRVRSLKPITLRLAYNNGNRYCYNAMIKSFGDKTTKKIFNREKINKIPEDLQRLALRKLTLLNAAVRLDELKVPPGNHLEKLKGDRNGQYSNRVNDQYRICFIWQNSDCFDVEMVDYH